MSTSNGQATSGITSGDDGGWFSSISGFFGNVERTAGQIGSTYNNIRPLWAGNNGQPAPAQPTFAGNSGNTTGSLTAPSALEKYMPYLLIGGAVLAVVFVMKK